MSDQFIEKAFAGRPMDHCLVIDAHGHIGDENPAFPITDSSIDRVIETMERMGIDLFCISAFAGLYGDADTGNRQVENVISKYPDRFFGYMCADVGYPERIVPQLDRSFSAGLRAIKIWSYGGRPGLQYDHPNYQFIFEWADAHAMPVLAHTWGGELDQLQPSIEKYPNINWLFAHSAVVEKTKYIRFAKDYNNVHLELALSSCPRGLVEELVREGLTEKLVWGSDANFLDAAHQLGRVVFAQISPDDKEKIVGLNARRALRLE